MGWMWFVPVVLSGYTLLSSHLIFFLLFFAYLKAVGANGSVSLYNTKECKSGTNRTSWEMLYSQTECTLINKCA